MNDEILAHSSTMFSHPIKYKYPMKGETDALAKICNNNKQSKEQSGKQQPHRETDVCENGKTQFSRQNNRRRNEEMAFKSFYRRPPSHT